MLASWIICEKWPLPTLRLLSWRDLLFLEKRKSWLFSEARLNPFLTQNWLNRALGGGSGVGLLVRASSDQRFGFFTILKSFLRIGQEPAALS